MSSCLKIVFGIKRRYQISDVLHIFKQQRLYNNLISQHNALDVDDCCDRPDVHYHGVVEFINEGKIENFLMQLSPYCQYISERHCTRPAEYLAYITLPPKRTICQEICFDSGKLSEYVQTAHCIQSEMLNKKKEKRKILLEQNEKIVTLVDFVLKYGCNSNNIMSRLKKNEPLLTLIQERPYKTLEPALNISKKIVLNNSVLTLSGRLEISDEYLSPEESARFVTNWCSFQKLDPKEFTKNLIRCLDKKSGNRNSIYLQGSGNSGKTYIVQSIIEACIHVGQVVIESSAYSFVWEKCVDKRLIVIREPHFSTFNFDQLDKILSGSGTLIFKHNDVVDYLQPTPVIILANEHGWIDNPELEGKIKKRFFCIYEDLQTFPVTTEKKLHPGWLNLLNKRFSGGNSPTPEQQNLQISFGRRHWNCGDKNVNGHSSNTNGRSDFFKKQITNKKQNAENTMASNLDFRKRPMSPKKGNDGGRMKKHRGV